MPTRLATRPLPWLRPSLPRGLRWLLAIALTGMVAWEALSIAYAPLPAAGVRLALAIVFAAFGTWALWRSPARWPMALVAALVAAWALAWMSIRPSHERDWRADVAVMPRIELDGDRARIHGYRHFVYRSLDDFDERWLEREIDLSKITGLDFYVSYWRPGPVAHTFVSFGIAGEDPVAISIETRPEQGEAFNPAASLFKRFDLIYVVGDERDIVKVRSNHRHEQVFLYHTRMSAEAARNLFRVYAERVNELHGQPEFYHLLSSNCTINIVRYANRVGRSGRFDIRHLLNGWSDRYLFRSGVADTSLPFDELRARSNINAAAQAASDAPDFPQRIREGLPLPPERRR